VNYSYSRSPLWGFFLILVPFCSVYGYTLKNNTVSAFVVKTIICPNLCLGQRTYKVVFEITDALISTDRGVVRNGTIFDIDPLNDYKVLIYITDSN
jgi:hypothetical protein